MSVRVQGLGVSGGVAIGRAYLLHAEPLPVVPDPVPPERVQAEIEAFERAREAARAELEILKQQVLDALGESYAGIFEAQKLVLDDPVLVEKTTQRIRVGRVSARWALKEVVSGLIRRFETVDDEYIRERGGELTDVQRRLQRLLRGEKVTEHVLPPGPLIVVAHSVGPSDAVVLAGQQVVGLATDIGGRTSHTAILAQALSLPAVVGLHDFSRRVRSGEEIVLDGDLGQVLVDPGEQERNDAEARRAASLDLESRVASVRELPAVSRDGREVVIRANIEFPSEVRRAVELGARGIGLYRSEFLFLSRSPALPTEEEHYETYCEIASAVAPHAAVVRTLDLGGEKYFHDVLEGEQAHPVLGLRAVRFCLTRPDVFRPQLRGLLRAAAEHDNLRVMLPLVSSPGEIRQVRQMLQEEAASLTADGLPNRVELPLGVMVEVPAAALAADILAPEVDFFSIGTNDLIQYALAVDRSNESLSYLYQPDHPGVLRLLEQIVGAAERQGIPVSICGEMAADPEIIGLLLGLGLTEISVQPRAIGTVRDAIRDLEVDDCRVRLEQALGRPRSRAPEVP